MCERIDPVADHRLMVIDVETRAKPRRGVETGLPAAVEIMAQRIRQDIVKKAIKCGVMRGIEMRRDHCALQGAARGGIFSRQNRMHGSRDAACALSAFQKMHQRRDHPIAEPRVVRQIEVG